jgi:hypothetical protein
MVRWLKMAEVRAAYTYTVKRRKGVDCKGRRHRPKECELPPNSRVLGIRPIDTTRSELCMYDREAILLFRWVIDWRTRQKYPDYWYYCSAMTIKHVQIPFPSTP